MAGPELPKSSGFNWEEICRSVDPCIRPGGTALTERALAVCNLPQGSRIADIGCGAGGTLRFLEGTGRYRLVGVDPSKTLLAVAAESAPTARLLAGSADDLPFENESFDAVFCECVLSVVDDRAVALAQLARIVKKGGYLILSDLTDGAWPTPAAVSAHGFSTILWEDHKRLLKEFMVRMIFADQPLPADLGCGKTMTGKKKDLTYFLLVGRKEGA